MADILGWHSWLAFLAGLYFGGKHGVSQDQWFTKSVAFGEMLAAGIFCCRLQVASRIP